jgi:hypothetical protein
VCRIALYKLSIVFYIVHSYTRHRYSYIFENNMFMHFVMCYCLWIYILFYSGASFRLIGMFAWLSSQISFYFQVLNCATHMALNSAENNMFLWRLMFTSKFQFYLSIFCHAYAWYSSFCPSAACRTMEN